MPAGCLRLVPIDPCARLWIDHCGLGNDELRLAILLGHSCASALVLLRWSTRVDSPAAT